MSICHLCNTSTPTVSDRLQLFKASWLTVGVWRDATEVIKKRFTIEWRAPASLHVGTSQTHLACALNDLAWMHRWKDAVVTEASVTPIRPIIPLAVLAIWDPKPHVSWSGQRPGPGNNVWDTIDTMVDIC